MTSWGSWDDSTFAALVSEMTISLSNTSASLHVMTHCTDGTDAAGAHIPTGVYVPVFVCCRRLRACASSKCSGFPFLHADRISSHCEDEYIYITKPALGGDPMEWWDPGVDTLSLTLCLSPRQDVLHKPLAAHTGDDFLLQMMCSCCFWLFLYFSHSVSFPFFSSVVI